MSVVDGFIFFRDWEKSMRMLSEEDFSALFWAMYDFQMYGKPFPEFEGLAGVIASFIAPQLRRRMSNALHGKRGAEAKWNDDCMRSSEPDTPMATPEAPPYISPKDMPMAYRIDKDIDKDIDTDRERERGTADGDARGEGAKAVASDVDERSRIVNSFGKYGNVFLTEKEYEDIRQKIPVCDDYIDQFSERLYTKGYRYYNHHKAILEWWNKDSVYYDRCLNADKHTTAESGAAKQGSFDTDSFFAISVRRSLGLPLDAPLPDISPPKSCDFNDV